MQYIIKYFSSFIFLCGIFLNSNASEWKGDSLYAEGDYFAASVEYERALFSSKNPGNIKLYKYKKALCYKNMSQFDRALNELQPLYFSNFEDSLYRFVSYEQSLCFYLNGEYSRALWKIDEYFHQSGDSATFQYFLPIRILCFNATFQWEMAEMNFLQYAKMQHFVKSKQDEIEQRIKQLYHKKNRPRIKSIKKAENLSRFMPGSGHVYAGETGEGILNFLINATVLTFAGIQVYNKFYITGYLAGLGFLNKTYHGGIKRAGVLAAQNNKEHILNFNHTITDWIVSDFELINNQKKQSK